MEQLKNLAENSVEKGDKDALDTGRKDWDIFCAWAYEDYSLVLFRGKICK